MVHSILRCEKQRYITGVFPAVNMAMLTMTTRCMPGFKPLGSSRSIEPLIRVVRLYSSYSAVDGMSVDCSEYASECSKNLLICVRSVNRSARDNHDRLADLVCSALFEALTLSTIKIRLKQITRWKMARCRQHQTFSEVDRPDEWLATICSCYRMPTLSRRAAGFQCIA